MSIASRVVTTLHEQRTLSHVSATVCTIRLRPEMHVLQQRSEPSAMNICIHRRLFFSKRSPRGLTAEDARLLGGVQGSSCVLGPAAGAFFAGWAQGFRFRQSISLCTSPAKLLHGFLGQLIGRKRLLFKELTEASQHAFRGSCVNQLLDFVVQTDGPQL